MPAEDDLVKEAQELRERLTSTANRLEDFIAQLQANVERLRVERSKGGQKTDG